MSNRMPRYTAGEIGRVRVIADFLPAPAELVPREDNVKVTLSLSRRSLDFFKREAKKREHSRRDEIAGRTTDHRPRSPEAAPLARQRFRDEQQRAAHLSPHGESL